ncbi:uncharacterized CRM domain-containing protein At3g25440, chloroplastic-like [Glycine max]|uniref:uncharacterized CRM domain-containing protein At3g25440, chloroplastic-like n=1 Tax=Glycine max TaxID=3847 RepID=UPI001B356FC8|nr:uncharacterized CRM domain-containing protein At3g25440, chloroplastic-like [Glycine max]
MFVLHPVVSLYSLEELNCLAKAKQKETWLVEKLRKFDVAKSPPETIIVYRGKNYVEPELRFYRLKAKKKMISPNLEVRIRYKLEKSFILTYNSKGQAKGNLELRKFDVAKSPPETIIVYHGKNYVEPEVMPPPNTLSKVKALEKYRYEQSLEHTSQFIERLEKGLEEYHQHLAKFKNGKNDIAKDVNLAGTASIKSLATSLANIGIVPKAN